MSNWGKGVINDIGWGQGANNDIGWGSIYDKSNAGETLLKSDLNIDAFIIEVDTSKIGVSNNNQFQFTGAEGDYDVVAKQNNIVVATFNDLSNQETITLPSSGIYVLEISAKEVNGFNSIQFARNGDKLKLSKIIQWGIFNTTRTSLFLGCLNLTEIADDNNWLNSLENGSNIFGGCSLTFIPSTLTLESLKFAFLMFRDNLLTDLPNGMNLNNLRNGQGMFNGNLLTDLPDGMNLNNLENGQGMFLNCEINTSRYSELLVDMENLNSNINVAFNGGNSKYNTEGGTARDILVNTYNWSITDGGQV
jgi:hypothetical protein